MLYGRYEHNIDAKGRIFVPAKLREKLGDAFIAAAVMDHCICLYSLEEWDKLQEGLAQMPMTKARKLQRYLSANATDVPGGRPGTGPAPPASAGVCRSAKRGAGYRRGKPGGNLEPWRL